MPIEMALTRTQQGASSGNERFQQSNPWKRVGIGKVERGA
jgi:hypothetical protein